jgi:phosphoribosylanthranilate isomerase
VNSLAKETTAAVTVIEITDPSEANEGIELVNLNAVQLHAGSLRARRVVMALAASQHAVDHPYARNQRL